MFDLASVNSISSTPLRVAVQEGLALEHGGEVVTDTLEELLDGGGVAKEDNCHLNTAWRDITLC